MLSESNKFEVTNLKISVKLPKPVDLEFVEERCKQLTFNTTIYCSRKARNILTIRYKGYTFILFKRSSKLLSDKCVIPQHCNITKIKSKDQIKEAIDCLLFLVDQPLSCLDYKIDNFSCCGSITKRVDIERFFTNEEDIISIYNEQNFPAVTIYSPFNDGSLCCHIFRSGRLIFVGGKSLEDTENFFLWILERTKPYQHQDE